VRFSVVMTVARHLVLPSQGPLLVSTDLHGNREDFLALCEVFAALGPAAHWVMLGDLVHGPDDRARREEPHLYGYDDASAELVRAVVKLVEAHPTRLHFVLGNHDHGHVGGPHTAKFHRDEVAHLEGSLDAATRDALRGLFQTALLAVAAPCGVLLTHGSPDDALDDLRDLDAIELGGRANSPAQRHVLASILRSYGQPRERTEALLEKLRATSGLALRVVIHGHDRDEMGLFFEGGNQVCPVLFGALRGEKRYVVLDLAARYERADDLRDGHEVRRLYPTG
jgi:Calcineurin-like phosphoesterase